jgi:hypothetical protein
MTEVLRDLIQRHGLAAVLRTLAMIMADRGSVTGGLLSEIAAIEGWLPPDPLAGWELVPHKQRAEIIRRAIARMGDAEHAADA